MPLLLALVSLFSCSQDIVNTDLDDEVTSVRVLAPEDIVFTGADTRGTEITSSDVLRFTWATTDTLGIFPNKGNQVEFPITSSEGGTSAVFNGGGWALKNQSSYAAYYPFSVWNYHRNNQKILLDYTGQVQDGNGSYAHLSAYDYLASSKTTPSNNTVTFQMNRQGSILYIDIPVPVPCKVNSLVVSCDEAIFVDKATLDISGDSPTVTPVNVSNSLTLTFENVETTEANENVRAYMAVSPVNFTDKTVTATLNTDQGPYSATVVSREVLKGKAAFLRFSEDFAPIMNNVILYTTTDGEIITPSGNELSGNKIVSNVYSNGVGLMTFQEDVINIHNSAFYLKTTLATITLPQSVQSIGNSAFSRCENLSSISVPETVSSIGSNAFGGCKISSFAIPKAMTTIERSTFSGTSLTSIEIPDNITTILDGAFQSCTKLVSIEIPESVVDIRSGIFHNCFS